MRVLVTRPQAQAEAWVTDLRAAGFDAHALPLLAIVPADDASALQAAWHALPRQALAVFVSPNAVQHFFGQRPAATAWPPGVLAAAPGPGTARALREAGVPAAAVIEPAADAAQFDSEALWQRLQPQRDWAGSEVLVLRGDGGRDWLAQRLRECGAHVRFMQAYRRAVPVLEPAQQALLAQALAQPAQHLWLLSSSEAVGHLTRLAPGADWSASQALASHARIAASACALGFGRVREVAPAREAVLQALRALSIQSAPP